MSDPKHIGTGVPMQDEVSDIANNGGPAFPTPAGLQHNDGMTLRDYFAAAALHGLLASLEPNQLWNNDDVAVTCYRTADAILRAREAKP